MEHHDHYHDHYHVRAQVKEWQIEVVAWLLTLVFVGLVFASAYYVRDAPELTEPLQAVHARPCTVSERGSPGRPGRTVYVTDCPAGVRPVVVTWQTIDP